MGIDPWPQPDRCRAYTNAIASRGDKFLPLALDLLALKACPRCVLRFLHIRSPVYASPAPHSNHLRTALELAKPAGSPWPSTDPHKQELETAPASSGLTGEEREPEVVLEGRGVGTNGVILDGTPSGGVREAEVADEARKSKRQRSEEARGPEGPPEGPVVPMETGPLNGTPVAETSQGGSERIFPIPQLAGEADAGLVDGAPMGTPRGSTGPSGVPEAPAVAAAGDSLLGGILREGTGQGNEAEVCAVCLGILQSVEGAVREVPDFVLNAFPVTDGAGGCWRAMSSASAPAIAGACREEGHVIQEVALEVTLPGATQVRALGAWHFLRQRHPEALQGPFMYQDVTDLKEALRLSLGSPLAEALGATLRQEADVKVMLSYVHPQSGTEVDFLYGGKAHRGSRQRRGKRKPAGGAVAVGRVASEAVLALAQDMPFEQFAQEVAVPPVVPTEGPHLMLRVRRTPLLVGGYYLKHQRDISNSKMIIEGVRKGRTSVEEEIQRVLHPILLCDASKFISAGREDVDVRMLGDGRPFVMEVLNARAAPPPASVFQQMQEEINKANSGGSSAEIAACRQRGPRPSQGRRVREAEIIRGRLSFALPRHRGDAGEAQPDGGGGSGTDHAQEGPAPASHAGSQENRAQHARQPRGRERSALAHPPPSNSGGNIHQGVRAFRRRPHPTSPGLPGGAERARRDPVPRRTAGSHGLPVTHRARWILES
eukprot:jgi/Botrbrau1/192/Bobra.0022s0172.1